MAQKLHSQYGFSYDNLKVLLGGWNAWHDANATDPTGYPIDPGPGTPAVTEPAATAPAPAGSGTTDATPTK